MGSRDRAGETFVAVTWDSETSNMQHAPNTPIDHDHIHTVDSRSFQGAAVPLMSCCQVWNTLNKHDVETVKKQWMTRIAFLGELRR